MTFPNITLELSPSSVFEDGTTNLVYTFTRTGITTSALTVNYSITGTADSSDYTGATPGTGKTITFAAGASTATLTIDPTVDTLIESDETVTLTLLPFSGTIANTISESASGGFGVTEKLYYIPHSAPQTVTEVNYVEKKLKRASKQTYKVKKGI
ncbi:hypothetical protein [Dolichospermum planctonicum]|uniref:Calx-beta domain-containing protein n=1 Tax=Dolichospermum planctonicum TaxID=136072 RepID=A0A480AGS2_9CYAN|nr:hypothetical protein [Dolichospermum planctonicum]GCL43999.1 hypothetical protein NIES80_37210 [Dolichospermum planctonicum]